MLDSVNKYEKVTFYTFVEYFYSKAKMRGCAADLKFCCPYFPRLMH